MHGVLFRYGPAPAHVAFRSAAPPPPPPPPPPQQQQQPGARRHLVLVAGLTDGLLALPYAPALAAAAGAAGFELVQAQLTSSLQGWGVGSLDRDADELLLLSRHLRAELGSEGIVMMGHSTGCQDAVRFCQRHGDAEGAAPLEGVILQGPVSDREWLSDCHPEVMALLPAAMQLAAANRGAHIVARAPDDLGGAPLSAARLVALAARLGDDDMWSGDLTDEEHAALLGHLAPRPLLVLLSGADECVADRGGIPLLGERILAAAAAGGAGAPGAAPDSGGGGGAAVLRRSIVLDGAPHNGEGHEPELAGQVRAFLEALPRRPAAAAG